MARRMTEMDTLKHRRENILKHNTELNLKIQGENLALTFQNPQSPTYRTMTYNDKGPTLHPSSRLNYIGLRPQREVSNSVTK